MTLARLKALVPAPIVTTYHLCQAVLAALWYRFPGRSLQVFGITGTNGKTTTAFFLRSILKAARRRTGLATTVLFDDGLKQWRNELKMTTVNAFQLQRLLRSMVNHRAQAAVIEVTSHALIQERVWGIPFDTTVFTNLTHDHLDYHGTMAEYQAAKERLFDRPHRVSVVNVAAEVAKRFLAFPATRKLSYGLTKEADVSAEALRSTSEGSQFRLSYAGQSVPVTLHLPGRFNVENALAAASAAIGANIGLEVIAEGLGALRAVPGRLESFEAGQSYQVFIDYAHTPDALKQVFETVRPLVKGKLIHVGGATGDRDQSKRPLLGAIAAQFADTVIVTNEDPGTENPDTIMNEVAAGVRRGGGRRRQFIPGKNFFLVLDRAAAIRQALSLAGKGDLVLITGKGDESAMMVKGQLIPYSDREVVLSALQGDADV